jgi:hypothetical protein
MMVLDFLKSLSNDFLGLCIRMLLKKFLCRSKGIEKRKLQLIYSNYQESSI